MEPKFRIGQTVRFAGLDSVILNLRAVGGAAQYYLEHGAARLPMWAPERLLEAEQVTGFPAVRFNRHAPHLLIVDDFYSHPDDIRAIALAQDYQANPQRYKGTRTPERFLWPGLREEFSRLLGRPVTDWLNLDTNGCFQLTGFDDPLVWHHDTQSYAAAIYLTPQAPLSGGTSFWRDRSHGCRRAPAHPLESRRWSQLAGREAAAKAVYDEYNLLHPDNWELVDRVGAVYNRLVIWDAQLIHSASSYEGFGNDATGASRLVQLFFFNIA